MSTKRGLASGGRGRLQGGSIGLKRVLWAVGARSICSSVEVLFVGGVCWGVRVCVSYLQNNHDFPFPVFGLSSLEESSPSSLAAHIVCDSVEFRARSLLSSSLHVPVCRH